MNLEVLMVYSLYFEIFHSYTRNRSRKHQENVKTYRTEPGEEKDNNKTRG